MINIDFLEYFLEFAKTESLTKASKSFHISQSALTRAMQKVEDYIEVPLFDRKKNKLSLNENGRELVKYAKNVLDSVKNMKEKMTEFYNMSTNITIGSIAPGPMFKYSNLFYSVLSDKSITIKIEEKENLIEKLLDGQYNFIFTSELVDNDELASQFAYSENLYIAVPSGHVLAGMKEGVYFKDIDGQSFLVANNLGKWEEIIDRKLPKSKFFKQSLDDLYEIVNSSTIPCFSTNITIPLVPRNNRVNIPILDNEASMQFYVVYKKQDKAKLNDFLKVLK